MAVLVIAMMSANAYADDITEESFVTSDVALEEPAVSSDTVSEEPPEVASEVAEEGEISDMTAENTDDEEIVDFTEIIHETPENEPEDTIEPEPAEADDVTPSETAIDKARARISTGKAGDEIDISDLKIPVEYMEELLIGISVDVDEIGFLDDGNIILLVMLGVPEGDTEEIDSEEKETEEAIQYEEQEEYAEPETIEEEPAEAEFISEAETEPEVPAEEESSADLTGYAMSILLGVAGILKKIAAM